MRRVRALQGVVYATAAAMLGCPPAAVMPPSGDVLFRDEFDGSRLSAGWIFEGDETEPATLEARPGFVRLPAQPPDPATPEPEFNSILRMQTGDFVLTTRMEFDPGADRQLAGLIVAGDDDRPVTFGIIEAEFGQTTFLRILATARLPDGTDLVEFEAITGEEVYLRLEREGDTFSFLYSTDGVTYFQPARFDVPLSETVQIGLGNVVRDNCNERCDQGSPADFDFFEVSVVSNDDEG